MARGSCNFRQRDVTALVKAIVAAGLAVRSVVLDREGCVRAHIVNANTDRRADLDDLDVELHQFEAEHGED